jgi:hypothetical protein
VDMPDTARLDSRELLSLTGIFPGYPCTGAHAAYSRCYHILRFHPPARNPESLLRRAFRIWLRGDLLG